ncbi:penicillin-binding protein 1A [Runella slithyformis]|uniref:Peptidoglycan glycosyltransferase n=1 Tax=Runella slithyformis (strain ATCC 29530 / DSM 19594 / LMG 11500 / NCIMB 11436 / LSU 4) TaxID=761193 RepID=A0A7U3ZPV7_RUNSL|nr:transglycosylase domain-containing protein [Runella slithyformis]AEI51182.1 Peptidoglycan glycosyltransferase [Runella slithyformis DSM 19594]
MAFLKGKYRKSIIVFWQLATLTIGGAVLYISAVYFNFFWLFGGMPDLKAIENPESQVASEILTADGQTLSKYFIENRTPVEFDQLSPNIVKALIATEDARFVKHSGIDPRSMFRVLKGVASSEAGTTGGGSTLTQQLAKNLFQTRSDKYKGILGDFPLIKTVIAKTKEWILSVRLERNYTKQEIMTMYLNTVSFGNNADGIKTASRTYFRKEPWNLNLTEAALLVGMLQNPSRYNPRVFKERALERRNVVLGQMAKYGFLTQESFFMNKLKPLGLNFNIENHNSGPAPYFREVLRDWMKTWLAQYNKENGTEYDLYTDGLRIYTTIDSRMQNYAEQAAEQHMKDQQVKFFNHFKALKMNPWVIKGTGGGYVPDPNFEKRAVKRSWRYRELKRILGEDEDKIWAEMRKPIKMKVFSWRGDRDTIMSPLDSIKYYNKFLRIGMVSMDPRNGDVKAWVGGINYKHFKYDQVYQGKRQPGSTFKPFVYCSAIDGNYVTPCETILDHQVCIGDWCPKNSTGSFSGQMLTLRQALAKSVNSISAYLMSRVGPKKVVEYAHKLGITSRLPENDVTICLGTPNVSVFEMVNAYCTFANSGKHVDPRFVTRIETKDGRVLAEFPPNEKEVISPSIAYQMLFVMRGAVEDPWGTAQRLRTQYKLADNNEIAAKTGTTSDYTDGWFMGITPNLVTGVWVGGEDNHVHFTSMEYGQGARIAMPAWGLYMQKVYADADLAGNERSPFRRDRFIKPDGMDVNINCGGVKIDTLNTYLRPKVTDDESILF